MKAVQSLSPHVIFLLFSLLCSPIGMAGEFSAGENPPDWQFSLGVGAGIRTNPVMNNSDIPLVLIPQVSYQGEHFFIQNVDVGYSIFQSDQQQLSLLVTPSYDQVFFNYWDANNFIAQTENMSLKDENNPTVEPVNKAINKRKLHPRRMAALGGLEYNLHWDMVDLQMQMQMLHEFTNYYDGDEARLALTKTIVLEKSDVKLTLGANWQSGKTVNYFYGLDQREAAGNQPYIADAGVTSLMRFDWNYRLNENWSLRFFTSYKHLSSPILNSPLITHNNVITAFAGGVYHF